MEKKYSKELEELIKEGNEIAKKQKLLYNKLQGFRKPIKISYQSPYINMRERELSLFEMNDFYMVW